MGSKVGRAACEEWLPTIGIGMAMATGNDSVAAGGGGRMYSLGETGPGARGVVIETRLRSCGARASPAHSPMVVAVRGVYGRSPPPTLVGVRGSGMSAKSSC